MIHGTFDDEGHLFFNVELITVDGLNLPVDAMLDTGFTGFLAMNKQDIDSLDWIFLRQDDLQTAQGISLFEIYLGKILLNGQKYDIPVFGSNNLTEVLLGSEWLKILPLVVDYQAGILTLG